MTTKNGTPVLVTITPHMAGAWLDAHAAVVEQSGRASLNRKVNDTRVAMYANDMLNDFWIANGETIILASNGRILDGQHRLWAAFNHEATFKTWVLKDMPDTEAVMRSINQGRPRSAGDVIGISGGVNGTKTAAAARLVLAYREGSMKVKHTFTRTQILDFVSAHERIAESVNVVGAMTIAPNSVLIAWHFLFAEKNREDADTFIADLRDGVGMTKGNPILALRERLIVNKSSKAKLDAATLFPFGIQVWNDARAGRSRTILKINDGTLPKVR